MITAADLVGELTARGIRAFAGVPCSFLTPLLNHVVADPALSYVAAANEGDAVAVGSGSELGGRPAVVMFQNSGLGNAVNPLTSLNATFRIPVLLITTWRGNPEAPPDAPQHELMGSITPRLFDLMGITWEPLPDEAEEIEAAVARASEHMAGTGLPFAFLMKKGQVEAGSEIDGPPAASSSVATVGGELAAAMPPDTVLKSVLEVTAEDIVVAATGYTGRGLAALEDRPNHLYMVGSMGCAPSLGLGLALARPDRRVVVLDGDGALLMRMGALATIGTERPSNLVHVLLDNGVHDSTGGQPTGAGNVDFASVAAASGYPAVRRAGSAMEVADSINQAQELTFVHVRTTARDGAPPRPQMAPPDVAARLRNWLG